jgi:hypothetical protein
MVYVMIKTEMLCYVSKSDSLCNFEEKDRLNAFMLSINHYGCCGGGGVAVVEAIMLPSQWKEDGSDALMRTAKHQEQCR